MFRFDDYRVDEDVFVLLSCEEVEEEDNPHDKRIDKIGPARHPTPKVNRFPEAPIMTILESIGMTVDVEMVRWCNNTASASSTRLTRGQENSHI
jgi:hypothetical protein